MLRKYFLEAAVWHETPLEFEWDEETGELCGRDAERVGELVAKIAAMGEIVSHPYPTTYEIRDPLRSRREMAVILGAFWRLPADLANEYPTKA